MRPKKPNNLQLRCDDKLRDALAKAARELGHDDISKLHRQILEQWLIQYELKQLGLTKIKP